MSIFEYTEEQIGTNTNANPPDVRDRVLADAYDRNRPNRQKDTGASQTDALERTKTPEAEKCDPFYFLNRSERAVAEGIVKALQEGSPNKVSKLLSQLTDDPKSAKNVMDAMQKYMQAFYPGSSMSWEQGTNHLGEAFVRMKLNRTNDFSKSAGSTSVSIESNGAFNATFTTRWDAKPQTVNDAGNALQAITRLKHLSVDDLQNWLVRPRLPNLIIDGDRRNQPPDRIINNYKKKE